jgi:hypothetical protein
MEQKHRNKVKGRAAKSVLRLPGLEVAKSAVLSSLSCPMRSGAIATPSRNGRELLYQAGDIGAENVDASTPRLSAKSWPLPTLSGVMSSWSTNHVYGWIFRPLGIAAIHIEDLSLMGLSRDRWRKSAHVHLVPARQVRGVSQQGRRPASRR